MADWHPVINTTPVEWVMLDPQERTSYVIIRRFAFGPKKEIWFRVVTGDPRREDRRLIGWCRTLEDAAKAGWDWSMAHQTWRHHLAATRQPNPPPSARPDPHSLLLTYREEIAKQAGSVPARHP